MVKKTILYSSFLSLLFVINVQAMDRASGLRAEIRALEAKVAALKGGAQVVAQRNLNAKRAELADLEAAGGGAQPAAPAQAPIQQQPARQQIARPIQQQPPAPIRQQPQVQGDEVEQLTVEAAQALRRVMSYGNQRVNATLQAAANGR